MYTRYVYICPILYTVKEIYFLLQILMSVPLEFITVTLMLSVPTPLVVSPVPVMMATVEIMDATVWVNSSPSLGHIDSVEI